MATNGVSRASKLRKAAPKRERVRASASPPTSNDAVSQSEALDTPDPKQLGAELRPLLRRGETAFAKFNASQLADKLPPNYVRHPKEVPKAQKAVLARGLQTIQAASPSRSIRLAKTPALARLTEAKPGTESAAPGTVDFAKLRTLLEASGDLHLVAPPVITSCKARLEADRRAKRITQPNGTGGTPAPTGAGEEAGTPAGGPAAGADAEALVEDHVRRQMDTATSPETRLSYAVGDRSRQLEELQANIQSFELRKGPSDTTAYHDFHTLQIAFENVWIELFDDRLASLGKQLFEQYVKLKQPLGLDDGKNPTISTLDDLKKLMTEVRSFIGLLPPPVRMPERGGGLFGSLLNFVDPKAQPTNTNNSGIADTSRLAQVLQGMEDLLSGEYRFKVFAADSINFGLMLTYRQTWEPLNYQVGDLISTVPLAPKEVRKYTTRTVSKKTRAVKEVESSLRLRRQEATDTSRVDAVIVEKAQNKSSFQLTAHESMGAKDSFQIDATQTVNGSQNKESQRTKKEIRESVLKSVEEHKQENRMEIDTNLTEETETTTAHELVNPNDELSVTYLFYELQRTYEISEKLHELTPVILVANHVPWPQEITDAWLMENGWILNRVILDDSYRAALDYLSKGFVGEEINLRILQDNAAVQRTLVDKLSQQLLVQSQVVTAGAQAVKEAAEAAVNAGQQQAMVDAIKGFFDPLKITGQTDLGTATAAQARQDYAKDQLDRSEKERRRLESQLEVAATALQAAIDKLANAAKEHYNKLAELDRLRVHVKQNILYYMQAIWSHEPADQRYFWLYDLDVPDFTANGTAVQMQPATAQAWETQSGEFVKASLPPPQLGVRTRKLGEIADLDTLLAYKGNYMIFPLKESNYLTLHLMQDYLDIGEQIRLRDPDEFGNYTLDEIQELAACVHEDDPDQFALLEPTFKQAVIDRLTSARKERERIVVPTTSLYIEALVGTHPLLEDFKLIHRALDVKRVQSEVRHAELENIRLAARALKGKDEDPDIDKRVVIENGGSVVVPTD